MYRIITILACLALSSETLIAQADWPQWRGSDSSGSIETGDFPTALSPERLAWKTTLPGKGCSTPIVVGDSIYITAPVEGNDALLALDLKGNQKWEAVFGRENAGKHRNGSGSNASPVSDGEGVFVYFKSGTLAAVNVDGTKRWSTNIVERFGPSNLFWDHGTSPVLTEKYVVMARMHDGESWLAAFDKQSGDLAWKEARNYQTKVENDHGYATPLLIKHQGEEALLVWGAEHLTIHRSKDGKAVWSCGNFNPDQKQLWPSISTPVIVDDTAVIAYGRNDRKLPLLFGIRLKGEGDVTKTNHAWMRNDVGTFVPSAVAFKGRVYLVRDRGEVECIDPQSGETFWSDALPKGRASYYASPLIANGLLVAPREDGVVFVARIGDDGFEVLGEYDMDEPVIGSPVPRGNQLLIRGEKHLYAFGS